MFATPLYPVDQPIICYYIEYAKPSLRVTHKKLEFNRITPEAHDIVLALSDPKKYLLVSYIFPYGLLATDFGDNTNNEQCESLHCE